MFFPGYVLPDELILRILSFLTPEALGQACRVCRNWNAFASEESLWNTFNLKKLFPSLKFIDEMIWKTHGDLTDFGLSIDDLQPQDKRKDIPILKRLVLQIKENLGVTILTMPKSSTLNKIVLLAKFTNQGNPIRYHDVRFF